jgi:hypothetical protein
MAQLRFFGALALVLVAQIPPEKPSVGSGLIAGQVVDPGTGKPVPEALVTLVIDEMSESGPRIMADAQGRFVFVNVPAGRYGMRAEKSGFYRGHYGQRTVESGARALELSDGQLLTDVIIPSWKVSAISGVVTDEVGQPVVGVRVQVRKKSIALGKAEFNPYGPLIGGAVTDDRGAYRIANIPPGEYAVAVPTTVTTMPTEIMAATQEPGSIRTQALFALRNYPAPLGDALTQQFGDAVLLTANNSVIPPPAGDSGVVAIYRTTFAPGTPLPAEASVVALGSGDERTLDIRLQPTRAWRVSGRLTGPEGPLPHTRISLVASGPFRIATADNPSMDNAAATALTDGTGRFVLLGVPEGEYVVTMNSRSQGVVIWASEPVTVRGADLTELAVTARRGTHLSVRFELRSGRLSADQQSGNWGASFYVWGKPLEPERGQLLLAPRGPDLVAEWMATPGRYGLTLGAPRGLSCTSVMRNGRDVTDEWLVVGTEDIDLTVICGEPATRVSGKVRRENGAADSDAAVVAFPVDRSFWTGPSVRRFLDAFSDTSGAFELINLPPGEYFLAAVPVAKSELWRDPQLLESLARSAIRMTLTQGESRTIDLRTVVIR